MTAYSITHFHPHHAFQNYSLVLGFRITTKNIEFEFLLYLITRLHEIKIHLLKLLLWIHNLTIKKIPEIHSYMHFGCKFVQLS